MSTFTDWNGPQGSNIRASDLLSLTKEYQKLLSDLQAHINSNPDATNVHHIKDYVDPLIGECVKLTALTEKLNGYYTRGQSDSKFASKESVAAIANKITPLATKEELNKYTPYTWAKGTTDNLTIRIDTLNLELNRAIAEINSFLKGDVVTFEGVLTSKASIKGFIEAFEQINFIDKKFNSQVIGSDTDGVYYVLGRLKDKGTAYISYRNTDSFSAVIDFTINNDKGALTVTTNCTLAGLKFKIVSGTRDNNTYYYLAIQSTEWIPQFAGTDRVGKFPVIEFYGSGINFIPVGSHGYIAPNGSTHDICDCVSGKGLSFSELATTILGKQIFRDYESPYITSKDITALDHVGVISGWNEWDENSIAINVPEGYHACDGTAVLATDDVSDTFRAKFTSYPLVDFSIIKTKSAVEVDIEGVDVATASLAQAVCALHGIKYYVDIRSLPTTAKEGEPVIVRIGNKYAVYVYKESEGWKKYSTEYNDINKTIGAVAAVIAAEHNADVYTVYNAIADLPNNESVETGALAIVFDGVTYTVFRYNGETWEIDV